MLISSSKVDYWKTLARHPRAITLRRKSQALGDNLFMSCLAREVKKVNPNRFVIVETEWPVLFEHNPNVDAIFTRLVAVKYCKIRYRIEPGTTQHIIDQMIGELPYKKIEWERKQDLYFADDQMNGVLDGLPEDYIVVNPHGKQKHSANRKEWGFERFQALRNCFSDRTFIQVGDPDAPLLNDVIDRRGESILNSAWLIRHALTGVFLEGGLMHVANAVNTPSVVIYGGLIHPDISGYDMHKNIYTHPECSPCFISDKAMPDCETMACMNMMTVEKVSDALQQLLAKEKGQG